jgi:hypothetical protein
MYTDMMYKKIIALYFFISFFSDIILNYLSRQAYAPASIKALKVYFLRPSIKNTLVRDFVSAANAGLTIVVAILVTMFLSFFLFKFAHPVTFNQLGKFLLLAFPIGYVMDVIIYKTDLFGPTLRPFYQIAGAGFWGAAAFIFSILMTFAILKKSI